jgi:hypothetical protein
VLGLLPARTFDTSWGSRRLDNAHCPLRGHEAQTEPQGSLHNRLFVACQACGSYTISETLLITIPTSPSENQRRFAAAAYVRQCTDDHVPPEMLTTDLYVDLLDRYPPLTSIEKVDRLLRYMAADSASPGFPVKAGQLPVYAVRLRVSDEESNRLRKFLSNSGFLEMRQDGDYLSPAGWRKVWQEHEAGVTSRRGFVAMSFKPSLNDVWEKGLKPGIEDCGCEAIRIDRVQHNEKICDRIVAEIRGCGYLVADVTRHRQGVYFEAGLAMGLQKPVIWTCCARELGRAHFDTRQYNHIPWDTPADLREKLRDRIKATIIPRLPGGS